MFEYALLLTVDGHDYVLLTLFDTGQAPRVLAVFEPIILIIIIKV